MTLSRFAHQRSREIESEGRIWHISLHAHYTGSVVLRVPVHSSWQSRLRARLDVHPLTPLRDRRLRIGPLPIPLTRLDLEVSRPSCDPTSWSGDARARWTASSVRSRRSIQRGCQTRCSNASNNAASIGQLTPNAPVTNQ
jgi:hypothetical protein